MGSCLISRAKKSKLDGFRTVEKIGCGGFSTVWKVEENSTSKTFAMKKMDKKQIYFRNCLKLVLNELKIHSQLTHPLILNLHQAVQSANHLYLITEYLEGGDLRYTYSYKSFSETEAKFLVACILSALEYLHSLGIIHGDLKPENLLFDNEGYLYIADFGTAHYANNDSKSLFGTFEYMAPEILQKKVDSLTSDYYSVGVILYEIICNRRPFHGKTKLDLVKAYKQGIPEIKAKRWSADAIDFVYKLLEINPCNRLGANGFNEIKGHSWFKNMNWEDLYHRKVQVPFVPESVNYSNVYIGSNKTKKRYHDIKLDQSLFADYTYSSNVHN